MQVLAAHRCAGNVDLALPTMLGRWGVLLCSLSLAGGCSLLADTHHVAYLAKRTTELEPKYFSYIHNDHVTRLRNYAAARDAWSEVRAESPKGYSSHYGRGFVRGFADYLYRGGTGEPPLVPPRTYWHLDYQSIKGKQAIADWYDGFRHGSQECRARGLRDLAVVPSSIVNPAVASLYDDSVADHEAPEIESPESLPPPN